MQKMKKIISILIILTFLCQDMAIAGSLLRVPVDEKRMARAIHGQSYLTAKGFQTQVFVDYEDAIEWLSDVTPIESDEM